MKTFHRISLLLAFVLAARLSALTARAHSAVEEMADAANHFLATLSPEQKAKAVYEVKDDERLNWHFVPKERKGLTFKEMNPPQRLLAQALLASGMSQRGYVKATTIMSLEQVLFDLEGKDRKFPRDPELYHVWIFGKPSTKDTWAWRVEGHHVSLNFTIVGGKEISATPSFFGTNPAEVRVGDRQGLRVLQAEEDLARHLVKSLNDEQKKAAIIAVEAPKDIITLAERKVKALEANGIAYGKLTPDQGALLSQLLKEYLYRARPEIADRDLEKIQTAGFSKILFAWAGGLEKGDPHYYRIQGPTFLMEYDCTQNNANHIHAVWRDFENDFGGDLLRKHYDQVPHP